MGTEQGPVGGGIPFPGISILEEEHHAGPGNDSFSQRGIDPVCIFLGEEFQIGTPHTRPIPDE
jgi:hypothetical protein